MVVWINGAFGVGKSHTAYELVRRLKDAVLFDPEKVGFFLRKHLPGASKYDDFQNMPLWRQQVLDNLNFCDNENLVTVVPMTIVEDDIYDFIIGGLREKGIDVQHFSLMATKQVVEKRLKRRGDGNAWNFKQIDRCLASLQRDKYVKHIDTEQNNLDEVVEKIANDIRIDLKLSRSCFTSKKLNWFKMTIRNI